MAIKSYRPDYFSNKKSIHFLKIWKIFYFKSGAKCFKLGLSALNLVQKRAAKFANNINELGWETSAQRRLIAWICALFTAYTGRQAWKVIGNRLLKPCYLSRGNHNWKIRTRKQRIDVGKFSFINRTINSCNQLPASLLASFPCKLNTFRKRVKNVVTSKGIQVGIECK